MQMLPSEIWAVILSLVAGLAGYAIREYQNRVSPLFEIIRISVSSKRSDRVQIDKSIVETLRNSFYPGEIQPEATLGDAHDIWDQCDDLVLFWQTTKQDITAAINAETDGDFRLKLGILLRKRYFDQFLMKLLLNSRLDFKITPEIASSPVVIDSWLVEGQRNEVWFDLPPAGASFGSHFDNPAIRGKCEPFIIAVTRLHRAGIESALGEFITIFDADYTKALSCIHELRKIVDENERWVTRCFLANTSTTPIVIERKGILTVEDTKTRTTYSEDCDLAILDRDGDLQDTDTPVVVAGGEGKRFALLTSQKQKEMNLGTALRELYERRDGKCHVSIRLRRLGLFGRQTHRSSIIEFSSPRKEPE